MAYNGRTGPNVSEYIANLNAIPSATDLPNDDEFNLDADLAMFTNTQFFDYDLGQDTDLQAADLGGDGHGQGQEGAVAPDSVDMNSLEFMNGKHLFHLYFALSLSVNILSFGTRVPRPTPDSGPSSAYPILPTPPLCADNAQIISCITTGLRRAPRA
jgi:hypothetical protein